jgi:hypothetical protein
MEKYWLYRYESELGHYRLLQSEPPRYERKTATQRADLLKQGFAGRFEYAVLQSDIPSLVIGPSVPCYKTSA